MKILDKRQNSGRSTLSKLVGTPRFELGTPCTPCGGSFTPKRKKSKGNQTDYLSRIADGSPQLSLCFTENRPPYSGRFLEADRCQCEGQCNRGHTGPCLNRHGTLAAGTRNPTRLVLRGDRVLCVGCLEPFDSTKRWRYPSAY